ncbi:MAG: hypothetical protein COA63_000500 [Methylophaga sp.]|nr:hypothetical protein [Methylophaga sp.]
MKYILAILLLNAIQTASADTIDQQSLQLCEKIKSCALAELEGHDMSADMKSMVLSSMDGMCQAMATEFSNDSIKEYDDLRKQATACMTSLSALSCPQLMDGATDTPECVALEKSAAEYE